MAGYAVKHLLFKFLLLKLINEACIDFALFDEGPLANKPYTQQRNFPDFTLVSVKSVALIRATPWCAVQRDPY